MSDRERSFLMFVRVRLAECGIDTYQLTHEEVIWYGVFFSLESVR